MMVPSVMRNLIITAERHSVYGVGARTGQCGVRDAEGWALGHRRRGDRDLVEAGLSGPGRAGGGSGASSVTFCHILLLLPQPRELLPTLPHTSRPLQSWGLHQEHIYSPVRGTPHPAGCRSAGGFAPDPPVWSPPHYDTLICFVLAQLTVIAGSDLSPEEMAALRGTA